MKTIANILWVILCFCILQPGETQTSMTGIIQGKIVDPQSNQPIGYATIKLFQEESQQLITGAISDSTGKFKVKEVAPGSYNLEVYFIGYSTKTMTNLEITRRNYIVNLGNISLQQSVGELEEVVVSADKEAIQYQLDKKIIRVDQQVIGAGGTATDLLQNVPSITVDIQGQVRLRGSTSFTVFIDGKPSILDANDALNQIPAKAIENIEIITNPSAKYDPDGTGGIINIITKKSSLDGISGLVSINAGLDDKYGTNFLLNYRKNKWNLYLTGNYTKRYYPSTTKTERRINNEEINTSIYSQGRSFWGRLNRKIKGGLDIEFTPKDTWGIAFSYGISDLSMGADLDYTQQFSTTSVLYSSNDDWRRLKSYPAWTMNYQHQFPQKGHVLNAQLIWDTSLSDEDSENRLIDLNGMLTGSQQNKEDDQSARFRSKIDYSLPLKNDGKFETGYQSRIAGVQESNQLLNYNLDNQAYEALPQFAYHTDYSRDVHAVYTLYAQKFNNLNYQLGLRGEYTKQIIHIDEENQDFSIDRLDYFPTTHISYNISNTQQLMASYSRRIERGRSYYLEPFITWTDAYNVRQGNPGLLPEYISSYEAGYLRYFGDHFISLEGYYRTTTNKIEQVSSVYRENVMLHRFFNVGQDFALGAELMIALDLRKWWHTNLTGTLYQYQIEGSALGQSFNSTSLNWNSRWNNTFKLGKNNTVIQFNSSYTSASVSPQGRIEGFFVSNFGIKTDLISHKLALNFQIQDIFNTSKTISIVEGEGFYLYQKTDPRTPMAILTLSFKFGEYKSKKRKSDDNNEEF